MADRSMIEATTPGFAPALARQYALPMLVLLALPCASALAADTGTNEFAWLQTLAAVLMLVAGTAIWLVIRYQTRRIRELKREAEKLRDADFGEPLRVQPGELGELAAVFNDMRDNDERVYKAIIVLFESKDDIEIFNKKAIYLYLREITGLNTKQVVNSLNKFREHYRDFRSDWENGKI